MPRKSSVALEFATTASRIAPPTDLTGPERALFVDLVTGCRGDHFQPTDVPMLSAYCRACVLEQTASSELAADGYVIDGKPSAWLPILQAATRTISTFSRMLRLNPAGRQWTPTSEPARVSYYEKMSLEHRDDSH